MHKSGSLLYSLIKNAAKQYGFAFARIAFNLKQAVIKIITLSAKIVVVKDLAV